MQIHAATVPGAPRDSATIVMLRDGEAGLEVFLLERHGLSDVLGGAYVFPGGKLDAEDLALAPRLDTPVAALHAALGEPALDPDLAAGLFVAAVREAFEETGVLYGASPVQAHEAHAMVRAGAHFNDAVESLGLTLAAGTLAPWSRWVTPLAGGVMRKRFDTRFFAARVPAGQSPVHDMQEAVASLWIAPRDALRRYWDGGIDLAPPQIMSLAHLARHHSVDGVLAEARAQRPPCVRPEPFEEDGQRVLCYPGDPRHPEPRRALPGPTRLRWCGRRFEPDGGLEALLG